MGANGSGLGRRTRKGGREWPAEGTKGHRSRRKEAFDGGLPFVFIPVHLRSKGLRISETGRGREPRLPGAAEGEVVVEIEEVEEGDNVVTVRSEARMFLLEPRTHLQIARRFLLQRH